MDPADLLRLLDAPVNGAIKTEDEIKKEPHEDDEEMMSTLGRQAVYARVFNVGYAVAMRMESHGDLIETDLIETKDKTILKWRKIWAKHRKGSTEKSKPDKKKKKTKTQPGWKVAKKVLTNRAAKNNDSGRMSSSPKVSFKSEKPPTPKNVTVKRAAKQNEKKEREQKQEPRTVEPAKKRGRLPKTTRSVEPPTKKQKFTKITSAKEKNDEGELTPAPKTAVGKKVSNEEEIKKETPKHEPKTAEPAKKRGRPAKAINITEPPNKKQNSTISNNTVEKKKYTCPTCSKAANKSTCLCNQCGEWIHLKCAKIRASQYDDSFRCQNCST